jgi:hypothetical protein
VLSQNAELLIPNCRLLKLWSLLKFSNRSKVNRLTPAYRAASSELQAATYDVYGVTLNMHFMAAKK